MLLGVQTKPLQPRQIRVNSQVNSQAKHSWHGSVTIFFCKFRNFLQTATLYKTCAELLLNSTPGKWRARFKWLQIQTKIFGNNHLGVLSNFAYNCIKKGRNHRCFPVNLMNFLKKTETVFYRTNMNACVWKFYDAEAAAHWCSIKKDV